MSLLLYIETNLIMAIAKGQDDRAESLFNNLPSNIRIGLPTICYMEALVVSDNVIKRYDKFMGLLDLEINEESRNIISPQAQLVFGQLEQLKFNYRKLLDEFQDRFYRTFEVIEQKIEFINLEIGTIQKTLQEPILTGKQERRDDLILQCILTHARQHTQTKKVFLSGNENQFDTKEAKRLLKDAGIVYFNQTKKCLDHINWWLNSQS